MEIAHESLYIEATVVRNSEKKYHQNARKRLYILKQGDLHQRALENDLYAAALRMVRKTVVEAKKGFNMETVFSESTGTSSLSAETFCGI